MLTKISAWFFALLMPLVVSFNSISINIPGLGNTVDIVYDFENEKAGSAAGTVTVKASLSGNYELFWGTEDAEKLSVDLNGNTVYYSEFASVGVSGGEGSADIHEFAAIPEGAETVLQGTAGNVITDDILAFLDDIPDNEDEEHDEEYFDEEDED